MKKNKKYSEKNPRNIDNSNIASFQTFAFSSNKKIILLFALTIFMGCATQQKSIKKWEAFEWQLLKSDEKHPNLKIYSRKVKGSKFKEYKAISKINVSPENAVKALREKNENSQKYIDGDVGYVEILSSSSDEILAYSVYKLPFPFKDREMCERFLFSDNQVTGVYKITWKEDWSVAPTAKENCVRMPLARGSWEFVPIEKNKSIATYIVHTEPGGSIKPWMVNSTIKKGVPAEFKSIEDISTSINN